MSDEDGLPNDYRDSLLDPAVVTMIADDLDERAGTLHDEADRLSDDARQLRKIAQELQDE